MKHKLLTPTGKFDFHTLHTVALETGFNPSLYFFLSFDVI